MANYVVSDTNLTAIANAIRTKGGTSASLEFPDDYVSAIGNIPTGTTPTGTKSITANGTYDVAAYANADVAVPLPTPRSASDVTVSGSTVTVTAGAYESNVSKSVASGTAGTPTATKGTVSNHSVDVTPSVTNTTGYISGSTINGTPVTVSASELVSGSETKTSNGTYDVTNLAQLIVNVSGGGGGASNIVTGTFKGTTTGAAMDVTLNYTGNGYPIAVMIYPTNGVVGNSAFYDLLQRYAIAIWSGAKRNVDASPTYGGQSSGVDAMSDLYMYKSSSSTKTSYSQGSGYNQTVYNDTDSSNTGGNAVKIRSKTKLSVYIADTSYGFAANIEYTYWVIYSA